MTKEEELEGIKKIVKEVEEQFDTSILVEYPTTNDELDCWLYITCDRHIYNHLDCKLLSFQTDYKNFKTTDEYFYLPIRKK